MLSQGKKLKRKSSPVEEVIDHYNRPSAKPKRSPIKALVEDSFDELFPYGDDDEAIEEATRPVHTKPRTISESAARGSSFNSLQKGETKKRPERMYIIRSIVVDKFTIPRKRVLLTPSMCQVYGCPFDIAEKNGYISWERVPTNEREAMLEALEEHKKFAHNNSENYIISESEMPTRWLGSERGFKEV